MKQKIFQIGLIFGFLLAYSMPAMAKDSKIAFIHLNRVLQQSASGQKSTQLLKAQMQQAQVQLKEKEQTIRQKESELNASLLLAEDAKRERQKEILQLKTQLRQDVQQLEKFMRSEEQRHMAKFLEEIRVIIAKVGKDQGYDYIIERGMKELILFSKTDLADLTDYIIDEYNRTQIKTK